jgi:hypothetical protein
MTDLEKLELKVGTTILTLHTLLDLYNRYYIELAEINHQ